MNLLGPIGTFFSPPRSRATLRSSGAALVSAGLVWLSPGPAALAASQVAPVPRVLLRAPFDVPPSKVDGVEVTVASAVREAGGAAIRARDFAKLVETRADVKAILDGARSEVKEGAALDRAGKHADAVKKLNTALDDYRSVGIEVWAPDELALAWAHLGVAKVHADLAAKKRVSAASLDACKRARTLAPGLKLTAPDFAPKDIAAFTKAAAKFPPTPPAPGDGFWSLARVMGLDALIEIRANSRGVLSLRAHRVHPANVKTTTIKSRAAGLDAGARKQLVAALGFVAPPAAVAAATTSATPTPVAITSSTPAPTPTMVAVATPPPTPAPTPETHATPAPIWISEGTPTPTPRAMAVATPAPTPSPAPAATPRRTETASRNGEPETRPTPGHVSLHGAYMANDASWVALVGGSDHRGAVYSATDHYVNAASGDGAAAGLRAWIVLGKSWAIDAGGAGIQRSYLLASNVKKSSTATEAWAHVLHSDDQNGTWWIGAGAGYISEPKFVLPGPGAEELVPSVTRIIPSVVGQARFVLLPRLEVRGRGLAGVALETTGANFGSGFGFDIAGEASAAFAVSHRVRLVAGGGAHRITSQYSKKQTEIEARRSVWAGVEAAF